MAEFTMENVYCLKALWMLLIRVITVLPETGGERDLINPNLKNLVRPAVARPNGVLVIPDLQEQWRGQIRSMIWSMCFCLTARIRPLMITNCQEPISEKIFSKLFTILSNQKTIILWK